MITRLVPSLAFLTLCSLATACPVATGVTLEPASEPDTGEPEVAEPECVALTIGDIVLDGRQDVQTIYSAPIEQEMGSPIIDDVLVFNFVNYNDRFGLAAIGTFPLDEPPNDNRGTCPECISIFVDQEGLNGTPAKVFFQTAGTITIEENPREGFFKGSVTGLELREAVIDPATLESTLVEGGECATVADFATNIRDVPDGWTCNEEQFNDGEFCDCTCGVVDPDCFCDPFTGADCSQPIPDDCSATETCTPDGCLESCDMFSSNTDCGGGLCVHSSPTTVCEENVINTDAAALGEACTGPLDETSYIYCGIEGSVPTGMCNHLTGLCAQVCDNDARCGDREYCYIIDTTGGFCDAGPPDTWFRCEEDLWSDGATCDCNCGIADPDCADDTLPVNGCDAGETCFDGICIGDEE